MGQRNTPADIVDYWLRDSVVAPTEALAQRERWYRGGPDADAKIKARFAADVELALAGELDDWTAHGEGALALVILLDQFTRTVYRGTARAFAGDAKAYAITEQAVAAGLDRALSVTGRIFLYHPHHHAETVAGQDRGLELLATIPPDADPLWYSYIERIIEGWGQHRDIVVRFGRFPHRNAALGRAGTAEEITYLEGGAQRFGQ